MSRESVARQPDLEPYEKPAQPPAEIVEFPVVVAGDLDDVEDSRPAPRARRAPARLGLSPALAGVVGAGAAVGLGVLIVAVPVAILWIFITGDGLAAGLRAGVTMWLGAQSVPVTIAGVGVSLLPWGFGLLLLLLISAVARWSAKLSGLSSSHRRQTMGLSVVAAIAYAALAAGAASVATQGAVLPARAAASGVVVLIVWWWSAAGRAGVRQEAISSLPDYARIGVRSGLVGAGLMGGAAGIALVMSVIVNRAEFLAMLSGPGDALGIAALSLLMLGYLPVALGWAAAYVLGPGFTLSAGVPVSPLSPVAADVTLPSLPWFAAVPTSGGALVMVLLVPVGVLTGTLLARRMRGIDDWRTRIATISVAAVTVGAIVGLVCRLSAGAAGMDRLASIGPNSIATALASAMTVVAGAALVEGALVVRRRLRRD